MWVEGPGTDCYLRRDTHAGEARGGEHAVYETIRYEVDGPVATLTLNRPERLNAVTNRMQDELRQIMTAVERNSAVVGVVLTGAGRAFCAGADVGDLEEQVADSLEEYRPERHDELQPGGADAEPHFQRGLTYLMAVRKPVIAAINGPCAGMGLAMAAASDVRFAGEDAFFVSAFAQRGLVAEHATSWILPRLLGPARALDLLWTGRRVSAEEALQIGLVNRVVAIEDLVPTAQSYVRDLARTTSRRSLMHVKQQVYQDLMRPLGPAMIDTEARMDESFTWSDYAEGVASFTERREPDFPPLELD